MRCLIAICLVAVTACSPSSQDSSKSQSHSGKWPPPDYAKFAERPPMSVGAELEDAWTLAIDAERWSYRIGRAIESLGATPIQEQDAAAKGDEMLVRAHAALTNAGTRLSQLKALACGTTPVAKSEDCASFVAPPWTKQETNINLLPPKDDLLARNQWLYQHAEQFVLPACEKAATRFNDPSYCNAE